MKLYGKKMIKKYKKLLILLCSFIIIFSLIIVLIKNNMIFIGGIRNMEIELYDSYIVDTTGLRERLSMTEDSPLIFFMQIQNLETAKEHILKQYRIEINDLDLNNKKYLVFTIGRKIEELEYERIRGRNKNSIANVVLSNEHHENMIYIYLTERLSLPHSFGYSTSFYVMDDEERVFLGSGVLSINERKLRVRGTE